MTASTGRSRQPPETAPWARGNASTGVSRTGNAGQKAGLAGSFPYPHLYGNMGPVKTTVELPDDLLIAAKQRAAELRCSLRTLIERGLRRELSADRTAGRSRKRVIRFVTVRGGLPPGLDLRDRGAMHDWLRRPS
jgi:hypothetical protein